MGDYKVNGTTYRFPDSYDDEKVKGILAAQGVISTAPTGPKVPALPRGLQADAPPPYSQGATAEKHGFKWQPEQEMSPEKFGEQLPGAAVTLASALMGPEVGILGRMAGVGGTGAASTMLGNLLQGKPQDITETAINGGLAAGTEGVGSLLGTLMQKTAAKSAATKQLQDLIMSHKAASMGHQNTALEHQGSINELAPQLPEAKEALAKASQAAEAKAVQTARETQAAAVEKAQAALDTQIAKGSQLEKKFTTQQQKIQTALKPENLDFEARAANPHTEGTSSWADFNKKFVAQQKIDLQNQLEAAKLKYTTAKETHAAFTEKLKEDAVAAKKLKVEPKPVDVEGLPEHSAYNELKSKLTDARKAQASARLEQQKVDLRTKALQEAQQPETGGLLGAVGKTVGGPVGKAASIYALYRLLSGQGQ